MTDLEHTLGVQSLGKNADAAKREFHGRFILSLSKPNNRGIGISEDKLHGMTKRKTK